MSAMNEQIPPVNEPETPGEAFGQPAAQTGPPAAPDGPVPFTVERAKEQATEAVGRVKQAGKEITTRPILDAIGSYFTRAVDGLIGLAEGVEGKARKKDSE